MGGGVLFVGGGVLFFRCPSEVQKYYEIHEKSSKKSQNTCKMSKNRINADILGPKMPTPHLVQRFSTFHTREKRKIVYGRPKLILPPGVLFVGRGSIFSIDL